MTLGPKSVAVRAWALPDYLRTPPPPSAARDPFVDLGPSKWQLIFDTETCTDLGQGIRLLTWQERHQGRLRTQGIAYIPEELTDDDKDIVRDYYCETHGLRCLTVEEWTHKVFFNIAWSKRGTVIGFNLTFDLSRLALAHETARVRHANRSMRGGWTFQLSTNPRMPRVQIKQVGPRASFMRFTTPAGRSPEARNREKGGSVADHRGYFVDVAVVGAAMLGRRLTLKLAGELLQTETRKSEARHGGPITKEYLDYAVNDTQATWECYAKLADRYAAYHLDTPLHKIYSEASIGKAHLRQIDLRPWRETQPNVPQWLIATILETYNGGRTETRIRRLPMPGVATDLMSEYPTVFVLQGLWRFFISKWIDWHAEDPAVVTGQLAALSVTGLLDPQFWAELHRLVLVEPNGDLLPTRAAYTGGNVYNLAVARRVGGPAQWFTYADVIVSWLETGRVPKILRVLRFTAGPSQPGLRPINLMGRPEYGIDPYRDDLIQRAVELRAEIRAQQDAAANAGDDDLADALDAQQLAMKIVANSTAYGTPIEINTVEQYRPYPVTVHLPNGASYTSHTTRTEEPGRYFHPLLATLVAGGGRLLLALMMRLVADRGGSYVFCDTDSLFIVATETGRLMPCPGGPHRLADGRDAVRALSWAQVREITEETRRLNPYGAPLTGEPLLKIEKENFDPVTGAQWQLYCFSIASKRYAPFRYDEHGRPVLVGKPGNYKRSEHGLGHLLDPTDPHPDQPQDRFRDQWWLRLLHLEHGLPVEDPDWLDRPAIGRLSVTSRHEENSFARHNTDRTYDQQTRPFNFGMMAFPKAGQPVQGALVAPLVTDPGHWHQLDWYQRGDPDAPPVRIRTGDPSFPIPGTVVVQSYRDVFNEYLQHPEAKAAGPDGKPSGPATRGLLLPLTIAAETFTRIGKETNRLADTDSLVDDENDEPVVYTQTRVCPGCGRPVTGRRRWCSEACRTRTARSRTRNDR